MKSTLLAVDPIESSLKMRINLGGDLSYVLENAEPCNETCFRLKIRGHIDTNLLHVANPQSAYIGSSTVRR